MNLVVAFRQFEQRVQALESLMLRRENVIRFLVVRLLLMLMMVLAFGLVSRHGLG